MSEPTATAAMPATPYHDALSTPAHSNINKQQNNPVGTPSSSFPTQTTRAPAAAAAAGGTAATTTPAAAAARAPPPPYEATTPAEAKAALAAAAATAVAPATPPVLKAVKQAEQQQVPAVTPSSPSVEAAAAEAAAAAAVAQSAEAPPDLDTQFQLARLFFRREKQQFALEYETTNTLLALARQAKLGPWSADTAPAVGWFDFVGKDRQRAWQALGQLDKREAKAQFHTLLAESAPAYGEWYQARLAERTAERKREAAERAALAERMRREALLQQQLALQRQMEATRRQAVAQQQLAQQAAAARARAQSEASNAGLSVGINGVVGVGSSSNDGGGGYSGGSTGDGGGGGGGASAGLPNVSELNSAAVQEQLADPKYVKQFVAGLEGKPKHEATVENGEVLTLRVPKAQDGPVQILWQFSTVDYDVGFGVDFECVEADGSITIDPILATSRCNSESRVVTGTHITSLPGTWLLKFDNSYSYFRSKRLFYRVLCNAQQQP